MSHPSSHRELAPPLTVATASLEVVHEDTVLLAVLTFGSGWYGGGALFPGGQGQ